MRFADSAVNSADRGQTNTENKLFVGGVPSGCGDKELRVLFTAYGEVLDVYILASKGSQEGQRGCAFVRYAQPSSCTTAIEALHGKYAMKAGELPLVVRYADPPKSQRIGGGYGASGRFAHGWPSSPGVWPSGPPPMGWPMPPWGSGAMGLPGPYPPWVMQPGIGQPGVPSYGYYGAQYGGPQPGPPSTHVQQPVGGVAPPQHYGHVPPPPPPGSKGATPAAPPANLAAWTEHITPDGLRYYYNTATGTSSWEPPPELQAMQMLQHRPQAVAPMPPLPAQVPASAGMGAAGGSLEHAIDALAIGQGQQNACNGGMPYAQPPSGGGGRELGTAGYISANGLGMTAGATGIPILSTLGGMPQNGVVESLLTAPGGGVGGERASSTTPVANGGGGADGSAGSNGNDSGAEVMQEWGTGSGGQFALGQYGTLSTESVAASR